MLIFERAGWDAIALSFVITLIAGVMRGFSGFGSAMTMAPVVSLLFGPQVAVPAIALQHALTSIQVIPGAVRVVNWRAIAPMGIAGAIGAPIGAVALIYIDQDLMRRLIAGSCLFFAVLLATGWRYRGPPRTEAKLTAGALGGILTGAAAMGGPPVVLYLMAGRDPATVNRATVILYFLFMQTATLGAFWIGGILTWEVVVLAVALCPPLIIGVWIGMAMFNRVSERAFRVAAIGIIVCVALVSLFR